MTRLRAVRRGERLVSQKQEVWRERQQIFQRWRFAMRFHESDSLARQENRISNSECDSRVVRERRAYHMKLERGQTLRVAGASHSQLRKVFDNDSLPVRNNERAGAWSKAQLKLLGKMPDSEVARLTGRSYKRVWAKRNELGINQKHRLNLARTSEAREKMSRAHEGRRSRESARDRERLRRIQRRPKSEAWKRKMSEFWRKRYGLTGRPKPWTEEELRLIGTRPDREVARLSDRSLAPVKAKKFAKRKTR